MRKTRAGSLCNYATGIEPVYQQALVQVWRCDQGVATLVAIYLFVCLLFRLTSVLFNWTDDMQDQHRKVS